jgi:hypothetical protein
MIIKIFKQYHHKIDDYRYYIPLNNNKMLVIGKTITGYYTIKLPLYKLIYKNTRVTINDNLYKMLLSEDMTIVEIGVNIIMKKYVI